MRDEDREDLKSSNPLEEHMPQAIQEIHRSLQDQVLKLSTRGHPRRESSELSASIPANSMSELGQDMELRKKKVMLTISQEDLDIEHDIELHPRRCWHRHCLKSNPQK